MKLDFEKWATSYAGMDGGNPRGPIWICGIEPGAGDEEPGKFNLSPVNEMPYMTPDNLSWFPNTSFDIKAVKLYAALMSEEPKHYKEVASRNRVFGHNSNSFKLNLYPIAFGHDDDEDAWKEWQFKVTGFASKTMYRAWCQDHRFAKLTAMTRQFAPRLIIGAGRGRHLRDFIMAFNGVDALFRSLENMTEERIQNKLLNRCLINDGKTLLVVVPFLGGPHGLSSDDLLSAFGARIRAHCESTFGTSWALAMP